MERHPMHHESLRYDLELPRTADREAARGLRLSVAAIIWACQRALSARRGFSAQGLGGIVRGRCRDEVFMVYRVSGNFRDVESGSRCWAAGFCARCPGVSIIDSGQWLL